MQLRAIGSTHSNWYYGMSVSAIPKAPEYGSD